MARPRGTGIYDDDEQILDEIEEAWRSGRYRSRTKAIEPLLDRIEGLSRDAKIKRMLRGLKAREKYREEAEACREPSLEERFRGVIKVLPPSGKARAIALRNQFKAEARIRRDQTVRNLIAQGVSVSAELHAQLTIDERELEEDKVEDLIARILRDMEIYIETE